MSVSGISSTSSLGQSLQAWQAKFQKVQSEFQQLGQDLQAGNLSQAQSDFSTLSQNISGTLNSNNSVTQAFAAVGSALQSGNLSAAQQAYSALQQDIQPAGQAHHHHHHNGANSPASNSSSAGTLTQLFSSLGSALQGGNLSAAQTAYSTLQQGLQNLGWGASVNLQTAPTAASWMG